MHITDIMRRDSPTFSFEFFPPKTPEAAEILYQTIRDLESYMPHFISVTYGAGGSTRDLTHDLVERIQTTTKLDPIPHLTCVCHKEGEIESILIRYAKTCIGNILALGGDPPRGCSYDKSSNAFQHAIDLVKFVRRFNESGRHPDRRGFGIGVAGFPEGHPRRQIDWLKWITSKRKWTPAPTTSSRNYFSIIATFSISVNVVRSPTFISLLSRASCLLPP